MLSSLVLWHFHVQEVNRTGGGSLRVHLAGKKSHESGEHRAEKRV